MIGSSLPQPYFTENNTWRLRMMASFLRLWCSESNFPLEIRPMLGWTGGHEVVRVVKAVPWKALGIMWSDTTVLETKYKYRGQRMPTGSSFFGAVRAPSVSGVKKSLYCRLDEPCVSRLPNYFFPWTIVTRIRGGGGYIRFCSAARSKNKTTTNPYSLD